MAALALAPGDSVLIVDDDPDEAEALSRIFQDSELDVECISDIDPGMDADEFLESVANDHKALISDHILSGRAPANFTGAQLVSKANRRPGRVLPAVLVSSHTYTDNTGSIAYHRADIPALVDKQEYDDTIMDAVDFTLDELNGVKVARERRAFVTPIEVLEVFPEGEVKRARVIVVGWRSFTSAWMPLEQITSATGLKADELQGRWLEAEVNCYAKRPDELFYRNICIAPELPDGWMSE